MISFYISPRILDSWLETLPRAATRHYLDPNGETMSPRHPAYWRWNPRHPVIIAASDVGGAEREHTSRDDNSSEGHPGTPAVLHGRSLPDTPLKAQDLKAEGTRASTLCRSDATSQSLPHPSGRFYPRVFHVRVPSCTPFAYPPRRPFVHVLQLFIAGMTGSLSLHGFGYRKESRTRFHVDAHRKQLNSMPGRFALPFEDSRGCADPITRTQRTLGDRFNLRFVRDSVPRRTFEETWVWTWMDVNIFVESSRV